MILDLGLDFLLWKKNDSFNRCPDIFDTFAKRLLLLEFSLYFAKFSRPEAYEEGGREGGKLSWFLTPVI